MIEPVKNSEILNHGRFNPHLISEPIGKTKEMVLATVMNDVGNGNKDEV